MLYWFQVYLLVAIPIFALAGAVLLTLMVATIFKNYIRARWTAWQAAGTTISDQDVSSPIQQAS